jgi:DNA-directed RNA polymerase specialized sigma24 family protein
MTDANKERPKGASTIPPFWIRQEDRGAPIDARVVEASQRLWPWAYRHVERELRDGARAAELLEQVAIEVSGRLQVAPRVAENLNGYLITAFHRQVRAHLLRNNRLVYEGLLKELEKNHRLVAPDWVTSLETDLTIGLLLSHLPHEIKHMLHYRMLDFSWRAIGKTMGLSAKQAKSRFYYGVQRAYQVLLDEQTRRARAQERE